MSVISLRGGKILKLAPSDAQRLEVDFELAGEVPIAIVPRSKGNVFEAGTRKLKDLLPCSTEESAGSVRDIETRFHVDLAAQDPDGVYRARRRVTAVIKGYEQQSQQSRQITWSVLTPKNSKLEFEDCLGRSKEKITSSDVDGMAEITITHPASAPASDRSPEGLVIIRAVSSDGAEARLRLMITRNDSVTELPRMRSASDLYLWTYQPGPPDSRSSSSPGIKELQEMLNEVVSRHRGISTYDFISLDGVFGKETRQAVTQYLEHFKAIKAGVDYPYDLGNIGISKQVSVYLNTEYAPFRVEEADGASKGWVVDRRLLWGDRDSILANEIDGLEELKRGVVDRLKAEMVRVANLYLDCDTFWMHHKNDSPHTNATQWIFRVRTATVLVRTQQGAAAPVLLDAAHVPVSVTAGQRFVSPQEQGPWVQIQTQAGLGWVPATAGRRHRNDQMNPRNSGTFGAGGVAYGYGCKDLPARFSDRLTKNPLAPPGNGANDPTRIAHWDEYEDGHKVGIHQAEYSAAAATRYTGCDCSGFTQNSITEARFPVPHSDQRVLPESIMKAIKIQGGGPIDCIPAAHYVGASRYVRAVPVPAPADASKRWVRQGDVLATTGHIVWFAEERPDVSGNNFEVFNEWGGTTHKLSDCVTDAPLSSNTTFLRKSILMPFYLWRPLTVKVNGALQIANGISVGKVIIWR